MNRGSFFRWLLDPAPPGLAIELRHDEMSLVRLADKRGSPEIDVSVRAPLAPGLVRFSMLEPNIVDGEGFRQALENLLLRGGSAGGKRVALVLPDYLSRIAVAEFPDAPRSTAEVVEFLKFKMKKSLPFDVEDARVAFERLPGESAAFLTGVMHEAVVSQYEEALGALGFQVGLVVPASLSLLQLLHPIARKALAPGADYFFVNVEHEYFTVSLVRDREELVLTRTLGLRDSESAEAGTVYEENDLLQEIIPTAIYYREKLAGRTLERVFYRSMRPDLVHLRELLEDQFEAPTEPLNLMKAIGVAKDVRMDAELADAVAAAAGAALGRAA
jgi:type IV pilus assembly protein PilM